MCCEISLCWIVRVTCPNEFLALFLRTVEFLRVIGSISRKRDGVSFQTKIHYLEYPVSQPGLNQ